MFSILENGVLKMIIDADELKFDLSNPLTPVAVFYKSGMEGALCDEGEDEDTPYIDWIPKGRRKKVKEEREKQKKERKERHEKEERDRKDKDHKDRVEKEKREKEEKEKKEKGDKEKKEKEGKDKKEKK